ncbi:MAG: alpha/beta hydrolase [Planctomycetota bacterium]
MRVRIAVFLWLVVDGALAQDAEPPAPAERPLVAVPYRTGDDLDAHARERCVLDLTLPRDTRGFATIVWFHGGGLTGGRRAVPPALTGHGVAVVAAGYRLSPHVPVTGCLQDAAAAVAWTLANIAEHGGDPRRVFVAGHSAGGYLATMVALDRRWLAEAGIDADALAGVVSCSGHSITHFTARRERGVADTQPVVDDLAPLFHVRKDAPPMLLVTGDRERELLGRYEETAYFWRMLRVVGHPDVQLREIEGYDHGGMVEPALPLVLEFVRARSRPKVVDPDGR